MTQSDVNLGLLDRVSRWLEASLDLLFGESTGSSARLAGLIYSGLYAVGLGIWAYILDFGRIPFGLHDWALGTGHRLAFLQNAVRQRRLPLHMPDGSALSNVTDRFLSVPDTILSPQVVLLEILELGQFVLANTLLLYTIGFVGLLLLAKRLKLSPFSFAIVFLLFSFNGHITDHVIVGHMHWVGYFLLPFYALLIFEAAERTPGWSWVLKFGLVTLLMFLQGAFHLFVMALLFLGLLAIGERRLRLPALKAGTAAILLNLGRILPPGLEAGKFDSVFLAGFESVHQLLSAFVDLRDSIPAEALDFNPLMPLGWWEIDHYLGAVGFAFVALFGIGYAWRAGVLNRTLAIPIFAMAFLSIGRIYKPLNLLGIPLLSGQRVATRFVIFSVVFLILLAAASLERYLRAHRPSTAGRLGLVGLLLLLGHDLWQHIKLWRIRSLYDLFDMRDVDLTGEFIANHPDPAYSVALAFGWGVALAALVVLAYLSRRRPGQAAC